MKTARLAGMALAATLALVAGSPTSAAPKHLHLANRDDRQSLTVHKGDEITVQLAGRQSADSTWAWSAPTSADGTVLRRDEAGTAADGDASAVFHARADGTTTLDARFRCVPRKEGQPCSHAVVPWQVTVRARR
ncbi:hypothetical protein [Streptacidiphilus anmyonensis]|uniref:hypothetical protein n=1 Tax=Streptacidiphilus anmyonensis TaxID=405782 RepID=UPI0005A5DE4C|nr:hypothetical protein [Streptacidiphilus anmyonensis]